MAPAPTRRQKIQEELAARQLNLGHLWALQCWKFHMGKWSNLIALLGKKAHIHLHGSFIWRWWFSPNSLEVGYVIVPLDGSSFLSEEKGQPIVLGPFWCYLWWKGVPPKCWWLRFLFGRNQLGCFEEKLMMADGWFYKANGCSHGWLMVEDVKNKSVRSGMSGWENLVMVLTQMSWML